jgi:hypothetical protein
MSKLLLILSTICLSATMVACEAKSRYQPGNAAAADAAEAAKKAEKERDEKAKADAAKKPATSAADAAEQEKIAKAAQDLADKEAATKAAKDAEEKRKAAEKAGNAGSGANPGDLANGGGGSPTPIPTLTPPTRPPVAVGRIPQPAATGGTQNPAGPAGQPAPVATTSTADQIAANKLLAESITSVVVSQPSEPKNEWEVKIETAAATHVSKVAHDASKAETGLTLTNVVATDTYKVALKCSTDKCKDYEVTIQNPGEKVTAQAKVTSKLFAIAKTQIVLNDNGADVTTSLKKVGAVGIREMSVINGKFSIAVITLYDDAQTPGRLATLTVDLVKTLPQDVTLAIADSAKDGFKDVTKAKLTLATPARLELTFPVGAKNAVLQVNATTGHNFGFPARVGPATPPAGARAP